MNYGRIYAVQYLSPAFPSSARSLLAKSIVRFCWFAFISFFWTALCSTSVSPLMHNNLVESRGLDALSPLAAATGTLTLR